jgi:hypothetical protein
MWRNVRYLIRWFLEAAERGTDQPEFPDITILMTVMAAIESGSILIPKRHREAVARAILKLKLDWGTGDKEK